MPRHAQRVREHLERRAGERRRGPAKTGAAGSWRLEMIPADKSRNARNPAPRSRRSCRGGTPFCSKAQSASRHDKRFVPQWQRMHRHAHGRYAGALPSPFHTGTTFYALSIKLPLHCKWKAASSEARKNSRASRSCAGRGAGCRRRQPSARRFW